MLTSHKLLYILPDVAYITELLPTKKEHTFAIHSFRQINGEFLDDNEFIIENVGKLINKIDEEELHLILPDFLFTNTIVEVQETDEAKVIEYLKKTLLPQLTLSPETHELKTFVLTNHGGKSKVQLSALEKSLMDAISLPAKEKGIKITGVSPLSWTIKSIISLEPSISIVQMGAHAYLAQHYIGIDQAISAPVSEIETLSETIKTLKGAEPSIQTVYLISNNLVEEKLKENLSDTLPLQQLASFKEEESEMPSYVKFCIEAGMKTLSLDVFPVPRFPLPAPTVDHLDSSTQKAASEDAEDTNEATMIQSQPTKELLIADTDSSDSSETELPSLPKPDIAELDTSPLTPAAAAVAPIVAIPVATEPNDAKSEDAESEDAKPDLPASDSAKDKPEMSPEKPIVEPSLPEIKAEPPTKIEEKAEEEKVEGEKAEEQSEIKTSEVEPISFGTSKNDEPEVSTPDSPVLKPASPIIKNQSGIQPMLKMLGISFVVFLVTVGVGIGAGQAFIYFTQQNSENIPSPVASVTPEASPTPTPSPSPSPEAALDPSKLSVLVVNATTKAGYAGATKSELETAKFGKVTAGNAKGTYEPGIYVLMETQDAALIDLLEESVGEELTFQDSIKVEDAQGSYDAVIVLAE